MEIKQVKNLFNQVSDFIRMVDSIDNLESNEMNVKNLQLVKTMKNYVYKLGVDYPVQAKILELRFFEQLKVHQVARKMNYHESFIWAKQKEALVMIADRFFNDYTQPGQQINQANIYQ